MESSAGSETLRAMFLAAAVAQCAGETDVRVNRIVGALLRTPSVAAFCERAQIDSVAVRASVDDPGHLTFDECEQVVMRDLARNGGMFASPEHQAVIQKRPVDPLIRPAIGRIIERLGHLGVPPLMLLLEVMRADAVLAVRLSAHGLTEGLIAASAEERT